MIWFVWRRKRVALTVALSLVALVGFPAVVGRLVLVARARDLDLIPCLREVSTGICSSEVWWLYVRSVITFFALLALAVAATAAVAGSAARREPPTATTYRGGPVEFERVVPASGNLGVAGEQFWLGPLRAGVTITFWADHDVIHLSAAGARVKTVRSHLSSNDLAALAATGGRPPDRLRCHPPNPASRWRSTGPSAVSG